MLESPFPLGIWGGGGGENKEKPNLESHCRQSLLIIQHHEVVLSFDPIPKLLKMLCHENSIFQKGQCLLQLITIQAKL